MEGAEPFFFNGNGVGCLCLHGLTASPAEVRWLGESLSERGFTVYGPRLAGHGVQHRHLAHLRWQDWYLNALDGYHLLRSQCHQVFVTGLSMGGLLTLLLAASEPVDAIAVMAAPIKLPNERILGLARWIKYVRPYVDLPDTTDFPQRLKAEQKRRGEADRGRVRYDTWASQAIGELHRLMWVVDRNLAGVNAPALLLYSEADETVPFENMAYVQKRIGSTVIQTVSLHQSGHILSQDNEYQKVLTQIGQFFEQAASKN